MTMKTPDSLIDEGKRLMQANDVSSAREAFERAVVGVEAERGPQAEELIVPLSWLAKAYRAERHDPCPEIDRSISAMARAILIAEASPRDERRLAAMLTFQGMSLWFNRQHEQAVDAVRRSLDLTRQWTTDTSEQTRLLAEILNDAGRSAEALVYARALVQQAEMTPGGRELHVYARLLFADCLRQAGPKTEARAVMLEILASDEAGQEEVKSVVQQWLGELDR